jgi:hypothetical protein
LLCVRRKLQRLVWEDSELSHAGLEYAAQLSWFTVEREESISIVGTYENFNLTKHVSTLT